MKKKLLILILTCVSLVSCKKPHEHSFSEWKVTKVATCNLEGEEKRTCECGEVETQSIAKLQHVEVVDEAVDATCTETGLTEGKHCSGAESYILKRAILLKPCSLFRHGKPLSLILTELLSHLYQ